MLLFLIFFFRVSVVSYVAFVLSLYPLFSFDASGRLCFVIVAFLGYFYAPNFEDPL